jgi:DNA-binding transcriptional MocR family regulator
VRRREWDVLADDVAGGVKIVEREKRHLFTLTVAIVMVKVHIVWVTHEWLPQPFIAGVKYQHIVNEIRQAVRSGHLRPGDQLPTHRVLARHLGVTVSTVTQAFAEAARLQLVSGEVGRGTFVLASSSDSQLFSRMATARGAAQEQGIIDLRANAPARDPRSSALSEAVAAVASSGVSEGYPTARTLVRGQISFESMLTSQGLSIGADRIVLTTGAQAALLSVLLLVAGPGSKVLAEELTFPGLRAAARQLRIELIPVKMDGHGILPDDLDRQAGRTKASTMVCVPLLQNPTGATMDHQRMVDVAEVARRRGLTIVDDDVYGPLIDSDRLISILPERTVMVTSVSKSVEPALRLGALIGSLDHVSAFLRETHMTSWGVSPLSIEVFGRWVDDGTAARRIAWQRTEVAARWRLAQQLLGESPMRPAPHRFLRLTRSAQRASTDLAEAGVLVVTSDELGVGPHPPKGIRISLTAAPSRSVLRQALLRIKDVLGSRLEM